MAGSVMINVIGGIPSSSKRLLRDKDDGSIVLDRVRARPLTLISIEGEKI